ncbi:methylated-DNA--[protein]-cysteine S-methyltransferase [Catenovulum sp. SM1970]|uniref:methylated-DNA--[protein]-cysteine S-methyltransferase n=1 Tax=Marinifaba aquimaris TaxID=2741323 RepID=UPI0015734E08|nr:methylated-DNA--[protein]-cysteine S-methyltransferase [Marinifaba aquimaris]NTS75449.1 methylated-DNA--[protein]-cysteine S-methyltransferase [Marinifaba aquimaris]
MGLYAQAVLETQVGKIAVFNNEEALTGIDLFADSIRYRIKNANDLTEQLVSQLSAYFAENLLDFDVPIFLQGTSFQQTVWQALCDIPAGECWTYGQLAKELGTSPRAIGGACRRNPIPIVVPCHRIVAASGIGGYSGQWQEGKKVDIKAWLLQHEQNQIDDQS